MPERGLRKHIGFWLRMVSNSVSHSFSEKLRRKNVTVAEWVVLREMFDGGNSIAPGQIAQMTGMSRGAVSKLVDRLVAKGLGTRKESAEDRRYQELRLTKEGRALVPVLGKLADENEEEYFAALTRIERKSLKALLIKIARENRLQKLPVE